MIGVGLDSPKRKRNQDSGEQNHLGQAHKKGTQVGWH
jgi:hypothetical protein